MSTKIKTVKLIVDNDVYYDVMMYNTVAQDLSFISCRYTFSVNTLVTYSMLFLLHVFTVVAQDQSDIQVSFY